MQKLYKNIFFSVNYSYNMCKRFQKRRRTYAEFRGICPNQERMRFPPESRKKPRPAGPGFRGKCRNPVSAAGRGETMKKLFCASPRLNRQRVCFVNIAPFFYGSNKLKVRFFPATSGRTCRSALQRWRRPAGRPKCRWRRSRRSFGWTERCSLQDSCARRWPVPRRG